ncbi:MAG: hypothetical protein NVV59_01445 [Chitinophagaceae bacterium]|nr:hypothetical protein [Chitinophagaceae bacterium]
MGQLTPILKSAMEGDHRLHDFRISTSKWPDKVEDCDGKFEDYKFYFRGEQNGKTVYAEVDATVETRKKKYFVLSSDNVNFVDSAPKMAFP